MTLFVFALGVMVPLVPEGLPATLSVSLAIGVRRMARRHALIKQLLAVEARRCRARQAARHCGGAGRRAAAEQVPQRCSPAPRTTATGQCA
ncbi:MULTISPECIES: cation-transporting P-type ATPase [Streptomyces]|uniref:cation-transporting P-type ATPase n=1 Tax=Streptomyces TaxID=1883 RepID=UPI00148869DB|nr:MULTISPECIES: cation-transporting P-type ATPase [Streptomyces]